MPGWLRWLSSLGRFRDEVLGINARNLDWVYPHNPRGELRVVDDKLLAKARLRAAGVPTPETLAVVRGYRDLAPLRTRLTELSGFVVKPAIGSGGRGILVVRRSAGGEMHAPSRRGSRAISVDEVLEYIAQLLSGLVSPAKLTETVFLEQLLEPDDRLGRIGASGLPDLRVISLRRRPVMAMLRLPTRRSQGKSNLHQGAVGLGVDLATGRTTHAVLGTCGIDRHPDTGNPLAGVQIPDWPRTLSIATAACASVDLGYVGVDLLFDRRQGPLVVELNARPGLAIQLANRSGLRQRLREVRDAR